MKGQQLFEQLTKKLINQVAQSKKKSDGRLERLRRDLELYHAQIEDPLDELIKSEFEPIVAELQENDNALLKCVSAF